MPISFVHNPVQQEAGQPLLVPCWLGLLRHTPEGGTYSLRKVHMFSQEETSYHFQDLGPGKHRKHSIGRCSVGRICASLPGRELTVLGLK